MAMRTRPAEVGDNIVCPMAEGNSGSGGSVTGRSAGDGDGRWAALHRNRKQERESAHISYARTLPTHRVRPAHIRAVMILSLFLSAGIVGAQYWPLVAAPVHAAPAMPARPLVPARPALPTSWSLVTSPSLDTSPVGLSGIAAVSPTDIWAVGGVFGNSQQTLTEHWNGATWKIVAGPSGGPSGDLQSVAAVSASDVWAVGGNASTLQPLIEQWNGAAWKVVSGPSVSGFATLFGISAVSASDLWAVGASDSGEAVIEQWNGSVWTLVPGASVGQNDGFTSVAAVSASDVWAVGSYTASNSNTQTLTEQWNGSTWSVVPSPNVGTFSVLRSVAAISTSDVWAVGYTNGSGGGGGYQTLTEHWNGATWSVVSSPSVGTQGDYLYGVAAVATNNVWAVGFLTTPSFGYQTLIEQWNGTAWSIVRSPSNGPDDSLGNVTAVSATNVWAVGAAGTSQALIEHDGYLLFAPARPLAPHARTLLESGGVW